MALPLRPYYPPPRALKSFFFINDQPFTPFPPSVLMTRLLKKRYNFFAASLRKERKEGEGKKGRDKGGKRGSTEMI